MKTDLENYFGNPDNYSQAKEIDMSDPDIRYILSVGERRFIDELRAVIAHGRQHIIQQ